MQCGGFAEHLLPIEGQPCRRDDLEILRAETIERSKSER